MVIVNIVFCLQGGNLECSKDSDDLSVGSLGLKKWFRTAKAIVLYLSDGTLQVTVMVLYTVKMVNSCQKKKKNLWHYKKPFSLKLKDLHLWLSGHINFGKQLPHCSSCRCV